MKYEWLDQYLLQKPAVTKDLKKEWNWLRYMIDGKMFAAVLLDANNQPYYINLKLAPDEGELMRSQYSDIIPGYYSNKLHWNSVKPDGDVPDKLLMSLLDRSYQLVLRGFSKQRQREILGLSCCGTKCCGCSFYGSICQGCNACSGKVFHAPSGKACRIYTCCVNQHHYRFCADCDQLPCDIWKETRDPNLTDTQFEASIRQRMQQMNQVI